MADNLTGIGRSPFAQITACTGQPILANNVTQAQAFCIATACLQVPVLRPPPRPLALANHLRERTMNKLALFKSLLWLKATSRDTKQNYQLPPPWPHAQHRLKRQLAGILGRPEVESSTTRVQFDECIED